VWRQEGMLRERLRENEMTTLQIPTEEGKLMARLDWMLGTF